MLTKPQRVGIRQFVQRVEQLNAYIAQLPCWYDSPSYNAGMLPHVCTPEKTHVPSSKKASHKNMAGAKGPSNGATKQAHKKVRFKKYCKLCKKHGGTHTMHAIKDCRKYEKDGTVKANFCAAKKAGKKPNPAKQSFAQLSKKLDKLEKTLKKASHKSKKRCRDNSNSDSE